MPRIVITGPESTGKTRLSIMLANYYQCRLIPEFAREYIQKLNRPYEKEDVITIGKEQLERYNEIIQTGENVFFDTWLIITKVWLKVVFKSDENWINNTIKEGKIDLYLLCATDLPWEPDSVRENGGQMREILFEMYKNELVTQRLPFRIIRGNGDERVNNAISAIDKYFKSTRTW